MNFGFSYVGLIFLLMLFIPNILWSKNLPKDYEKYSKNENRILLILERIGEVLVVVFALFCGAKFSLDLILLIAFLLMIIYELYWIKYFKSSKTMRDMYCDFYNIPLPGATLPVASSFLLGIYTNNLFFILSSIILAIGHIGIHYNHKCEIDS